MLPCHAYPGLKKYKHLVGNYGGAWQDQPKSSTHFPGADPDDHQLHPEAEGELPRPHLHQRAGGLAGRAAHRPGSRLHAGDQCRAGGAGLRRRRPEQKTITVGFGHNAVLGVADKVIAAVKQGRSAISSSSAAATAPSRAATITPTSPRQVPKDCVILTLACGKYRFNKLEFGADRRHPAAAGHRPVQRRLFGDPDRRWPWPGRSSAG